MKIDEGEARDCVCVCVCVREFELRNQKEKKSLKQLRGMNV